MRQSSLPSGASKSTPCLRKSSGWGWGGSCIGDNIPNARSWRSQDRCPGDRDEGELILVVEETVKKMEGVGRDTLKLQGLQKWQTCWAKPSQGTLVGLGCESRMGAQGHGDAELTELKSGIDGSVLVPIDRAGKLRHWNPVYSPVRYRE